MSGISDPSSYGLMGAIPSLVDGRSLDLQTPPGLPREIAPGVFWLGVCSVRASPSGVIHSGNSTYLVVGSAKSVLIDTGYIQTFPEMSRQVDACLNGRSLDFIMPTHPELPHSGSLGLFLERYDNATAIGDVRDYGLYYPEHADRFKEVPIGETINLGGGYVFHMMEALLKDLPNTRWGYERSVRVLFVADGFAYLHHPDVAQEAPDTHLPSECGRVSAPGDGFPTVDQIQHYTSFAFYWARYRDDADELFARVEALLDEYNVALLAPSHGNPILDLKRVIEATRLGHKRAYLASQDA